MKVLLRRTGLALALLVTIVTVLLPTPEGLTPAGKNLVGVFAVALILWVTEAIPIAVTSFLVIVLQWLLQITTPVAAIAGFMTPVFLLTDGYIANGAEPWSIPKISDLAPIEIKHPTSPPTNENAYLPYLRDERLVRPWAVPGTPGLEHRIGGIEKADVTGNICYDPENHEHMTRIRRQKVANIADAIPQQNVEGPASGDVLLVSWGGTFGAVRTAAAEARRRGESVAHCHLRYLNPFPKNLGAILSRYRRVLVPELNSGQLRLLLRATFLVDAVGVNKVQGKPFLVSELLRAIEQAVVK